MICPFCSEEMPEIGCEKTSTCPNCEHEWKYNDNGSLVEVEENDDIYLDR